MGARHRDLDLMVMGPVCMRDRTWFHSVHINSRNEMSEIPPMVDIRTFEEVVLFELQRTKKNSLRFADIWSLCEAAAPHLPEPIDPKNEKKKFISQILLALNNLKNRGTIELHTKESGAKISHLTLTRESMVMIASMNFVNQDRMGKMTKRHFPHRSHFPTTHDKFIRRD
jgi:hypothetical protein